MVAVAIGFAVWSWLAYSRIVELGYEHRLRPGWALGAWFIPFANLYLPKRIIDDLVDAGSSPEAVTTATISLRRWTTAWWASWVVTFVSGVIAHQMEKNAKTLDAAMAATTAYMVRDVLLLVAAVLAIVSVHRMTRQQRALAVAR
jgi:hypothetical protein